MASFPAHVPCRPTLEGRGRSLDTLARRPGLLAVMRGAFSSDFSIRKTGGLVCHYLAARSEFTVEKADLSVTPFRSSQT